MLEAARAEGLDVAADQYPYTAAATTLATILPPRLLGLGVEGCVAALATSRSGTASRRRWSAASPAGRTWPRTRAGPALRISYAASHPDWAGRSLAELGENARARPGRPRLRCAGRRPPRRLGGHPLHGRGRRRDDHGRALDRASAPTPRAADPATRSSTPGRPHPRTYGSTARVLGTYVRERGTIVTSRRPSPS